MNFTIDRAKTLFTRDDDDTTEWETALNNALPFARDEFESIVGDDELLRFLATYESIPVTDFTQADGEWSMKYDNTFFTLKVGEKIKTGSQEFKLSYVDSTGLIKGAGKITGTPSTISNLTMETELNIHAYCVVAMVTKTASQLLMNTILPEQTQRGDDVSYRAYDPIKTYRDSNLKMASSIFLNIDKIVNDQPPVEVNRYYRG